MLDDELEHKNGDPARHTTRESREAQKEHYARLPRDTGPTVAERVGRQALLLDAVDDEHAQRREDEGEPVDEGDVHVGAVKRRLGPNSRIEEDVEGEGKLAARHGELVKC